MKNDIVALMFHFHNSVPRSCSPIARLNEAHCRLNEYGTAHSIYLLLPFSTFGAFVCVCVCFHLSNLNAETRSFASNLSAHHVAI